MQEECEIVPGLVFFLYNCSYAGTFYILLLVYLCLFSCVPILVSICFYTKPSRWNRLTHFDVFGFLSWIKRVKLWQMRLIIFILPSNIQCFVGFSSIGFLLALFFLIYWILFALCIESLNLLLQTCAYLIINWFLRIHILKLLYGLIKM